MSGLYGDMTDEELNFWERLPLVMQVLSTPQFGCWLIRRDKNREQSADVRPNVQGKWVNGFCNQCGEHAPHWAMATTYYESDYCPNCGADMKGGN